MPAGSAGQGSTNGAEASGGEGSGGAPASGAASQGAGASGGGGTGAGAVALGTEVRSGGAAVAASTGKSGPSQAEFDAIKARNSELEGLLSDAVNRRKSVAEERDDFKSKWEQANAQASEANGKLRKHQAVAEVSQKVPLAHRQAAIDALHRLHAEGAIDLAGEDRKATAAAAEEKLKADYPKYFEEPATVPRMPGVNSNKVPTQKVGVHNELGQRIL